MTCWRWSDFSPEVGVINYEDVSARQIRIRKRQLQGPQCLTILHRKKDTNIDKRLKQTEVKNKEEGENGGKIQK